MKIETLKERIQLTTAKLIKLNGTIERHTKQLNKHITILTANNVDINNYSRHNAEGKSHEQYWTMSDYESKLEDIKSNNKKIAEATKTLTTLTEQLEKQLAQDEENNSIIPECLNIFLENFKQKCFKYFTDLTAEYLEIKNNIYEITREELQQLKCKNYDSKTRSNVIVNRYTPENIEKILTTKLTSSDINNLKAYIKDRHMTDFINSHFASEISVVYKITDTGTIDTDLLNKILDDDNKLRRDGFIKRIKEVIGDIKDLSNLKIVGHGEINGIAVGSKCNAKVETIGAGGHTTQCYHYRILVNTVK